MHTPPGQTVAPLAAIAADTTPIAAAPPTLGVCLAFGVGTIGTAVLLNTVTVYLPAFMATVLGQSVAAAGLLLTLSKLYDVVCDIVIGLVSDRTRSRFGRRRPYMLAGSIVGSLAFGLIFAPPIVTGHALLWEMGLLLVLYSTGYSLFNVPYLALPPELAGDYHGRTRLLSYRTFFVSIGQFTALSVSGWLLHAIGGGRHGYAVMGLLLGAIILLTELGSVVCLRGAPSALPPATPGGPNRPELASLFSNGPLCLLMAAKFSQLLGVSIAISSSLLFMLNVLGIGYVAQADFSLAQNVAIALSMPVWVRASRRRGKRLCAMAAAAIYAAGSLTWLLAAPGETMTVIALRGAMIGFAAGGLLLMASSMLPDVMEYDVRRTGLRREGLFSSVFAVIEKSAFAIGPGLIGVYLSHAGYLPTRFGHIVAQPAGVVSALYVGVAVLPAVMVGLSVLFLSFYRLDENTLSRSRPQP
jgi:GPH family glycoside/pentoside/hexuronide:cation symporter